MPSSRSTAPPFVPDPGVRRRTLDADEVPAEPPVEPRLIVPPVVASSEPPPARQMVAVPPEADGQRVDSFLAGAVAGLTRTRIQALVKAGHVRSAAGLIAEPSRAVKSGDRYEVEMPPPTPASPAGEAMALEILYEDGDLVVLVKPAGLVVHPAPGHAAGTLVNALIAHCGDSLSGVGGVRRPGIVHRLDKEVSGVLVVAKHDRAHLGLAGQFTVHSVHRAYEAIVLGVPAAMSGRVDQPIGRDPKDRLRMAVVAGGKRARTDYRVLATAGLAAARVEATLHTGRTHQIRVHLASLGNPIVGDRLYRGNRSRPMAPAARRTVETMGRIALHARDLAFVHPISGCKLAFQAPPPPLFDSLLALLGP